MRSEGRYRSRGAVVALACTAGCSGVAIHRDAAPGPAFPSRLVAVYPFTLRWKAPAYRSYELAVDEVSAVLADGRVGALGPTEFQVMSYESDALFAATSLAGSISSWGLLPDNLLGLRGWAERREASDTEILYDTAGKPIGQRRNADVKLVVHEELLGPTPGAVLAEAWASIPIDPFADHPTYDPEPELRRWVKKLTGIVLDQASPRIAGVAQVTDPGFDVEADRRDEETFELSGQPSLATLLSGVGPLDKEAIRMDRLLYFDPDLTPQRIALLERLPQGLVVTKVRSGDAKAVGLQPDDVIVRVQGEPASGVQTLLRWLSSRPAAAPVELTVVRAAEHLTVKLPSPAR